jgi:hypothetical protein
MLHLLGPGARLCDGLTRRHFLTVGGLGLAGLTLPSLLQGRAVAADRQTGDGGSRKATSCILLYMWGRPLPAGDLRPEARGAGRHPGRVSADRHEGPRDEHL